MKIHRLKLTDFTSADAHMKLKRLYLALLP